MKKLNFTLLIITSFLIMTISSCSLVSELGTIQVRFENISDYDIDDIVVQEQNIGTLKSGNQTAYFTFDDFKMSGNMITELITVETDGFQYQNNTFCWVCIVGEDYRFELENGKYTITLDITKPTEANDGTPALIVNLIEE